MHERSEGALFLSEQDVRSVLTMPIAMDMVEQAMRDRTLGKAIDSPRTQIACRSGPLRLLQAAAPELGLVGFKYTYVGPARRCCFIHLIAIDSGDLEAVIDGDWLGMVRTGAASGVASRYLAPDGAAILGQIGAGWQASGQFEAVCLALGLRSARVYARRRDPLEAFCARMSKKLGIEVMPAASAEQAVQGAQVVNVITQAEQPVLLGRWLLAGQHVNAAGSNSRSRRELDSDAIDRCDVIVVDGRANARLECGDLVQAVEHGFLTWDRLAELGEIMTGRACGRSSPDQVTLYESHGLGIQDLYVAAKVLHLARVARVGTRLPLGAAPMRSGKRSSKLRRIGNGTTEPSK